MFTDLIQTHWGSTGDDEEFQCLEREDICWLIRCVEEMCLNGEKSPFVSITVRQCTTPMPSSAPARGGPVARHAEAGPGGSTNDLLSHKCSASAILVVVEIIHLQ